MVLKKREKELLHFLVEKELKQVEEEGEDILRPGIVLLRGEEKYEDFLKALLKKLR